MTFKFQETVEDRRKGVPYVARLVWSYDKNRIERQFIDMSRQFSKRGVTVYGTYTAESGELIEERTHGGSWRNDQRQVWLITDTGRVPVADPDGDSRAMAEVGKYLQTKEMPEAWRALEVVR